MSAAVVAATSAMLLTGGTAAQAVSSQCGTSQSCLWKDVNFQEGGTTFFHSLLTSKDTFGAMNNLASSLWNRQAGTIRYYSGQSQTGTWIAVSSGISLNVLTSLNDNLESFIRV